MKAKIRQEDIEKALKGVKISYTVETVYSCILKDGVLEIEDNREKIRAEFEAERLKYRKAPKPEKSGSGNEPAITND